MGEQAGSDAGRVSGELTEAGGSVVIAAATIGETSPPYPAGSTTCTVDYRARAR